MTARLTIEHETLTVGDVTLKFAHGCRFDAWMNKDEPILLLLKGPNLIEDLDRFFTSHSREAKSIFELGIWDGGSTAFWFEYLQPDKLVAIDYLDRENDPTFEAYVERKRLSKRIRTYWRTNQADRERLREIVLTEFDDPLDLVIDDASHELHATKTSFETLFPLLRPGGTYLLEDWSWETHPCFREEGHPWATREGLVEFVKGLVDDIPRGPVRQLSIWPGFAAIERR